MAIKKYYDKSVLKEEYARLSGSSAPEAARCLGAVRALQGCSLAFDAEEIKAVCRGMVRLSKADKKTVCENPEIGVLYENVREWIIQRAGMLRDGSEDANREVLNDLLWNICPYWIKLRRLLAKNSKAGRKEKLK